MTLDEASELRKTLERERALFQRFEELRLVGAQMRMILAHDIKGPLAVMIGAADLMSKGSERLTEERSTKLFRALLGSVEQIQAVISTGDTEAWATLMKPAVVDLVAVARRVSDVQVQGAGEISTYHPAMAEALLQHLLPPPRGLIYPPMETG